MMRDIFINLEDELTRHIGTLRLLSGVETKYETSTNNAQT
jgi:hypothetical protein